MAIVETKNQYYFYFDIDGNADFAENGGGINSFVIEEFAGGSLPMFEFVFTTCDFNILKSINEGSVINCTYGETSDKTDTLTMMIQKFEYRIIDASFMLVTTKGFIGTTPHLSKCEIKGWASKTSLEVIKDVASIDYTVKSRATNTSDTQNWIRYNIPANRFIQEVWEHSYISDDNFLLYAINRHNEFVIYDYKRVSTQPEKWTFNLKEDSGNKIAISPRYVIHSNHGLVNNIAVYERERRVFDLENGGKDEKVKTPSKSAVLASGSKINVQSTDPKNYGKVRMKHEALHENYHKAYYNNISKIALYGATEIDIETDSVYKDYELYDICKFENFEQDKNGLDTELLAGLFIITRISRYWANDRFRTALTLSKEALNNLKGDLK